MVNSLFPAPRELPKRRHLSPPQLLAATFAAAILVGTLLLWLPLSHEPGASVSLLDALFTATSAVCVTGLAVLDVGATFNIIGEALILLLVQIGGLGVLTFGALAALAVGRRMGVRQRLNLQNQMRAFQVGGIGRLLTTIFLVALAAELLGAVLLWAVFSPHEGAARGAYFALFHAVSAFNNAGLSLYPDSLASFATNPLLNLTLSALALLGALGFVVIVNLAGRAWRGRSVRLSLHTRIVLLATVFLSLVTTVFFLALEWSNPATLGSFEQAARPLVALFQGLVARTSGFATLDYADVRPATLFFMLPLMFIGGSPGSTAGGIKTVTFVVLVGSIWSQVRGRGDLTLFGRRISSQNAVQAGAIALLGVVLVGVAILALLLTEPDLPFAAIMFEVVSAFGTVGLTTGVTPELSHPGRIVLIVLMYLGRLGPLTLGVALMQDRNEQLLHYPQEEVLIG